jgi:GTP cyclohydrolase I
MEKLITEILKEIGDNPEREGLLETPKRVAKMYKEVFYGLKVPAPNFKMFESNYSGILVKTFKCFGWCEHHLAPIEFEISFGYIPNGKVTGISKIIRRVKWWTARPSIQENLTEMIVDDFEKELNPKGVMLIVKGRHFCELLRGVEVDSWTTTSSVRGSFKDNLSTREEFLKLI